MGCQYTPPPPHTHTHTHTPCSSCQQNYLCRTCTRGNMGHQEIGPTRMYKRQLWALAREQLCGPSEGGGHTPPPTVKWHPKQSHVVGGCGVGPREKVQHGFSPEVLVLHQVLLYLTDLTPLQVSIFFNFYLIFYLP